MAPGEASLSLPSAALQNFWVLGQIRHSAACGPACILQAFTREHRDTHMPLSCWLPSLPFCGMADRWAGRQDCQWSCLAFIYTLGSFCISILYVSLFRWCVNSMYTFFFLRVMQLVFVCASVLCSTFPHVHRFLLKYFHKTGCYQK